MDVVPADIKRLLEDCEFYVGKVLQDETLGKYSQDTRETLLRNFRVVRGRNPQYFSARVSLFPLKAKIKKMYQLQGESVDSGPDDSSDDNQSVSLGPSVPSDDVSVASDYQDDGSPEYFEEIPVVAAQELSNVLKQGYLEKKRRDHSFFGSEWQRRWCVLNNTIFYYFGSEKDKQQKGSFYINGYSAGLVGTLRKDSKRNSCFELSAPGQRSFQFTASSPKEAREWVDQINFVLKDLSSSFIPFDEDEEDEVEGEDETYDDVDAVTSPPAPRPAPAPQTQEERKGGQPEAEEEDDDIYEVLPEDDFPALAEEGAEKRQKAAGSVDYANFYQCLWDCEGDEPDELTFNRGDLIYIISKEYNIHGWWVGELNGFIGIVPKDFLQPAYIL